MPSSGVFELVAGTVVASGDVFPMVDVSDATQAPQGSLIKITAASLFAGAQPITIASGTVTVSTPVLQATQTWNAGGVTFTAIDLNVTATASAAASLLINLRVGGTSVWKVDKAGAQTIASGATANGLLITASATSTTLVLDNTNGSSQGACVQVKQGGTFRGFTGVSGSWLGTTASNFAIGAYTGGALEFYTDGSSTVALTIATTRAAAFAGSLTSLAGGSASTLAKPTQVLYQNTNLTTSSNGVEVSLATFSLPAATLSTNGQSIRITLWGQALTVGGLPNIKFGATSLFVGGAAAIGAGNAFRAEIVLSRTGAATQVANALVVDGNALDSATGRTAPAETLSGAITLDFRGSCSGAGTLNVEGVLVELLTS